MEKKKILSLAAAIALMGSVSLYGGSEGDGADNVFYGNGAGDNLGGGGSNNVFMGLNAGHDTFGGGNNTFSGYESGKFNTTSSDNTFSGSYSGRSNETGSYNTFSGSSSGTSNETGSYNTFSGYQSGYSNISSWHNVFIGYQSGYSNTGANENVFIGNQSGFNSIGDSNVFIGSFSGYTNTNGSGNVFSGVNSGYSNTDGGANTFSGNQSGYSNTTGSQNTFSGYQSGYNNTTGYNNTFMGIDSGYNANINASVLLGHHAGYNATRDNTLYISNSDTNDSLIYGEFDTGLVKINGRLNTTGVITSDLVVDNPLAREAALALSRENNGTGHSDVGFTLENKTDGGGFKWAFQTAFQSEGFTTTKIGTGGYEFSVENPTDDVDNVELAAAGKVFFTGGHLVNPSSRTYKDNIKTLDTKTALEAFEKLEAVTFVYKMIKWSVSSLKMYPNCLQ